MILPLYEQLSNQIKYYLPEVKTIALFNNQYKFGNGDNKDGQKWKAFQYPAVFLEFNNFQFRQLSLGVEEFDFDLTVHFGWKTLKTEDVEQLRMLEQLYWVIQRFQQGGFARLSRINEVWDTSKTDVGVTRITYHGYGKDYKRYVFNGAEQAVITGATFVFDYTQSVPYSGNTSLYSGATDSNGNNMWQGWPNYSGGTHNWPYQQ